MMLEKTSGRGVVMIFLAMLIIVSLTAISFSAPVINTSYITFDRENEEMTFFINGTDDSGVVDAELDIYYGGSLITWFDQNCSIVQGDAFICTSTYTQDDGFDFERGKMASISGILINLTNNITTVPGFNNITPNKEPRIFDCNNDAGLPDICEDIYGNANDYGIRIVNDTFNDKPRLTCEYEYIDDDGDTEVTQNKTVKWYVQNEGFGEFIELLGENNSKLLWPKFDQNDNIICSVSVNDGLENSIFFNSSEVTHTENSVPNLFYIETTSNFTNPIQVGEELTLTAKIYDNDIDTDNGELLNVSFCKNEINTVQTKGGTDFVDIGLYNETSNDGSTHPVLWIFSDLKETPIEIIRIISSEVFTDNMSVSFSEPIYDLYGYEVDSFGEIPTNNLNFVTSDYDNVIVANKSTRINLEYNAIISQNKFLAIKLCIDSNDDGTCDDVKGDGDYFTVPGNESINQKSGENKSYFGYSENDNLDQTMFHSDEISFTYGLSTLGGADCGSNFMCSAQTDPTDVGPIYSVECKYTPQSLDFANQTYSAFASDKFFSDVPGEYYYLPDSETSRTLNSEFYVNHLPVASGVQLELENGTKIQTYTTDNKSLYCNYSISDSDTNTFNGTNYDTTSYSIEWYYKRSGQSAYQKLIAPPQTKIIAHGNTNPGDQWYCAVTPSDGFSSGNQEISQVVTIIGDGEEEYFTTPIITRVSDGSYNDNTGVYLGNNFSVNVQWKSVENTEYNAYVCSGNYTEINFIGTGCSGPEFESTTIDGTEVPGTGAKNYTISFEIDGISMGGPHYYTVFVCDQNFSCSTATGNATGDFYVRQVTQQYTIEVRDPNNLTTDGTLEMVGILADDSNGEEVDVWSYILGESYPFKVANTTSFGNLNPPIDTGAINANANAGATYIYIENVGDASSEFNGTNEYVGFPHDREYYEYYEYDYIDQSSNFIIINLTEPLEENIYVGDEIKTFAYKNYSGRFTINVNLWGNNWNRLEFFSNNGGYLDYSKNIFYDATGPIISVSSDSDNQSLIKTGGVVKLELTDAFSLNLSSINIYVDSTKNEQHFKLQNNNGWQVTEVPSIRDYLVSSYNSLKMGTENVTIDFIIAEDAPNENYTFLVESLDTAGNSNNLSQIFEYNKDPMEITGQEIRDAVTKNATLRSNEVLVSWESEDEYYLENYSIDLIEKVGTIETTIYSNYTKNKNITFTYDNLSTSACYYAKIGSNSRFGVSSEIIQTDCVSYSESDNLILQIISNAKDEDVIYFNNTVSFQIETYNAAEIAYRIEKISNNQILTQETGVATESEISNKYAVNFNKTAGWDEQLYKIFVNATGFDEQFDEKEYLLIMDTQNPRVLSLDNYGPYNNTDNISISVITRDDGAVQAVLLESNMTGNNQNYSVVDNIQTNIGGINYYNYTIQLDNSLLTSKTTFDISFIISDYAGNRNESETRTITINNRAPYNTSSMPTIYWNKTSVYGEAYMESFFEEPDGDALNYTLITDFGDIGINKFDGTIFGGFRNFVGNSANLTIVVEDGKNLNDTENITVILLTETCLPYKGNNKIFVGFSASCNSPDYDSSEDGEDSEEDTVDEDSGSSPSGGSSSSSSSGSSSGGLSAPPVVVEGDSIQKLYNILAGERTSADFENSVVTEIQFKYSEEIAYTQLTITESDFAPTGIPVPDKPVYTYFTLEHLNIENNELEETIIRFKVPINNNLGLNTDNVLLGRWNGASWDTYNAVNYGNDGEYYFYAARVSGMSTFAILKDEPVEIEEDKPAQITTPTVPNEPTTRRSQQIAEPEEKTNMLPIVIFSLGIIVIVVGIGGGFYLKNKKPKQQVVETVKQEPKVVIDPLEDYIKKHLKKGIAFSEIKAALLKAGWNIKEIDYALNKVESNKKEIDFTLVDDPLVKQIKGMQDKHYTKKEIKEELESRFIQDDLITANMYYVEVLDKLEKEVTSWIKKGYTKKQIRDHLLDLKWPAITIYEILKKYN